MHMIPEIEIKLGRIRKFLKEQDLKGLVINKVANFAWCTGGKSNYVALHTYFGAASLFITSDKIYLLSNNIEASRLKEEEIGGLEIEEKVALWFEDSALREIPKKIVGSEKIGCDVNWPGFAPVEIEPLHFPLTTYEVERYRNLGKTSSQIMTEVCREIKVGQTECEIAGVLSRKLWTFNIVPVVILIAADERIKKFRHPLPTENRIKNYVMIVLCAKKYGLIVSLTRLVYFGKLPQDLEIKHKAVCSVDTVFISETKPGNSIGAIFQKAKEMYEKTGYLEEWKLHHQGGSTGYQTRYFRGFLNDKRKVEVGQAFAWNPSVTGTKSEDTILVSENETEILTEDKNWPKLELEYSHQKILRPAILLR